MVLTPRSGAQAAKTVAGGLLKENLGKIIGHFPLSPPHILDISRLDGTPWANLAFDTSNPNWSSAVVGGHTFDGSSAHPFEWVSVMNPTLEQDDEVGLAGTVIQPDISGEDLPFTHPFGNDFEFTIAPDPAYDSLLAPANKDANGVYKDSWPAAQGLGISVPGFLGLEVDAGIVPGADRPRHGDRVATYGRWIVDAGHPEFHTEIHPPLLLAYARSENAAGTPVAASADAITHFQLWGRPYQAAQKFSSGGDTNLCLQDYVTDIVETLGSITAYPPIHAKPFTGVHLVAFTVRPPGQPQTAGGPAASAAVPSHVLECSYHFTVNGSCGVEVITSPADANAVLVLVSLSDAGYPSLPEPPSQMKQLSISALLNEAKALGENIAWYKSAFLTLKSWQLSDNVGFRIFNAPATSAHDSENVVPFTPLRSLPSQTVTTDKTQAFPVRGWLKIAWIPTQTTRASA